MLGINNKDIKELVNSADTRVENGYLYLGETHAAGGRLALRYEMGNGVSTRQAELYYAPIDKGPYLSARTTGVFIKYQLKY